MEHHSMENLKATVTAARYARTVARSLDAQGFPWYAADNRALCTIYMERARHIAATLKARAAAIDAAMARDAQEYAARVARVAAMCKAVTPAAAAAYAAMDAAAKNAAAAAACVAFELNAAIYSDTYAGTCYSIAAVKSALIGMVKSGEYIRRTVAARRVYIRGEYVRSLRAYGCHAADDINAIIYIKSSKPVFYGFTY